MDFEKQLKLLPSIQIGQKGSSFLYLPESGDHYLLFTARHCIQNKPFSAVTPELKQEISLNFKFGPQNVSYKLSDSDDVTLPDNMGIDMACIKLAKTSLPGIEDIAIVRIMEGVTANTRVKFRGYPNYADGNLRTVNGCIETDGHDTEFHVIPDEANFTDIDIAALDKVSGYSGSGVFTILNESIYLIGIIKQYDQNSNRFIGTWISPVQQTFLPDTKISDFKIESILSADWFDSHINKSTSGLGPRFSKDHFPVSLQTEFDIFAETDAFYKRFEEFRQILAPYFKGFQDWLKIEPQTLLDFPIGKNNLSLDESINFAVFLRKIQEEIAKVNFYFPAIKSPGFDRKLLHSSVAILESFLGFAVKVYGESKPSKTQLESLNYAKSWENSMRLLHAEISSYHDFLLKVRSIQAQPYLLIEGKAGSGKSQLSAFMARKLKEENHPTVLVLGHNLARTTDVWDQILNQLKLGNRNSFLDALNKKAQRENKLAILFIDAMNEGMGVRIWNTYFTSFIHTVSSYHHIRMVFTYRTTFKQAIFRNITLDVKPLEHKGFSGMEMRALEYFCTVYGIKVPDPRDIKNIISDFANPLFMKLFCQASLSGHFKGNLSSAEGMVWIINNFLKNVNAELGTENSFGYRAQRINLVAMAVDVLIDFLLQENCTNWKYPQAFQLVDSKVGIYTNKKGFLDGLIDEEVLMENPSGEDEHDLDLEFAYQKLGEYLTAHRLLAGKDVIQIRKEFKSGTISKLFADNNENQNDGLFLALTHYIREKFELDIFEFLPDMLNLEHWEPEILANVPATNNSPTDNRIIQLIEQLIASDDSEKMALVLDAIIPVATLPNRYFNADFLHHWLIELDIRRRDLIWTTYINSHYTSIEEQSNIAAVLNKCFPEIKENGSRSLNAICVTWFLSSSNRRLRDDATKCLIILLNHEVGLLISLLGQFENIDDPYVRQRLMAVAYGCAINYLGYEALTTLCNHVLTSVFSVEHVVPDILYRDYARGIIEFGKHKGVKFSESPEIAFKKFSSPSFDLPFPTIQQIDEMIKQSADGSGYFRIGRSMATEFARSTYGDFGRYIFGSAVRYWIVDEEGLSNYVVKEIFDRYYTEQHSIYDQQTPAFRQQEKKRTVERLGKKYQWILFHEILARLADNFQFKDRHGDQVKFSGPWNPMVRDIDPTRLDRFGMINQEVWYSNSHFRGHLGYVLEHYIKTGALKTDLILPLIELKDRKGDRWIVLESFADSISIDNIEISIQIRSYLVDEGKFPKFKSELSKKDFWGRWMPESHNTYRIYRGEFFWSQAVRDEKISDKLGVNLPYTGEYIGSVYPTAIDFTWEAENDLSFSPGLSSLIPSRRLSDGIQVETDLSGQYYYLNQDHGLFMISTGKRSNRLDHLIIRKNTLDQMMKDNKMKIFWTVLGEIIKIDGTNNVTMKTFSGMPFYEKEELNLSSVRLRDRRGDVI